MLDPETLVRLKKAAKKLGITLEDAIKVYEANAHRKEYREKYNARPYVKEKRKAYNRTPARKAARKAYNHDRYEMMKAIEKLTAE